MRSVLFGLACAVLTAPLHATAIFTAGSVPVPGNVIFTTNQSGSTVMVGTDQSSILVDFSSTSDVLTTAANGLTARDGLINNVTISLAGGLAFGELIIDPAAGPRTNSGITRVTAVLADGSKSRYTYSAPLGAWQNFLKILAGGGPLISSVTIDSTDGLDALNQVRISEIPGASRISAATGVTFVPEPGSSALLAGGLLLLLPAFRRKRRT